MVYMNTRWQEILSMLLKANDYTSLRQIADALGVSKRSIYYDLCKLNEWLVYYGVQELEIVRGKGILILPETVKKITKITEGERMEETYIFSPSERIEVIYCYILISHLSEKVTVEQLAEYCNVSRNTIFNDLRVLVERIKEYNLSLEYSTRKGYKIGGDVVTIRAMFFMYFNELLPLYDRGALDFIHKEPILEYKGKLKQIAEELKTEYVDGVLLGLAALVPLMYHGARRPFFPNLKKEKIINTQEYYLTKRYFPDLDDTEYLFLCIHLLGSRVAVSKIDMFDHDADESLYEITKALVAEFEKRACVFFDDREELERALFLHIRSSLYRYRYGVQIGNNMAEDVIREYENLFEITKKVSEFLKQLVGVPISDNEVAYLALHFGAHLKEAQDINGKLRILIVCVNGVSTGNMLKREVHALLPEAQIVDVVAVLNIKNVSEICDFVISTVKITSDVPVVKIHPILTDYDRKLILQCNRKSEEKQTHFEDGLLEVIKKYVASEDYDKLKKDMNHYICNYQSLNRREKGMAGLIPILKKERIEITDKDFNWQEAIRFAGRRLIETGSIKRNYLNNIISQILYYGPYMFITNGLVLAHAKPEDGVDKMDVSLTIFKHPVQFKENQTAKIIITLAVSDQTSHIRVLNDIMTIFAEINQVDKIAEFVTAKEVIDYMEQRIQPQI